MIHKHVTKRDLLRNPKQSFPQSPDELVTIVDKGIPLYSLSMNAVSYASSVEPDKTFQITKTPEGQMKIHSHKEDKP